MDGKTFVTIWQTSETFAEVVRKTKMKPSTASMNANRMRWNGVPLKRFKFRMVEAGRNEKAWAELAALAVSLEKPTPEPREKDTKEKT